MKGASALAFIAFATLRNMIRRQIRRLREPRYLIATLFGLFYVVNLVWQPGLRTRGIRPPSELAVPLRAGALTWLGMLFVLGGWIFGGDEAGLAFTEAEIQFLFPAPLSRRQLVSYKLTRTVVLALVSALLLSLTLGRRLASSVPLFVLGAWIGVATLTLHLVAASLTRQSLLQQGVRGPARRLVALLVPAAIVGAAIAGIARAPRAWPTTWSEAPRYFAALLDAPPVSWVSFPLGAAAHVALARDVHEIALWLPASVAVLLLHFAWALSTDTAFEQASLAGAERRSQRVDRMRRGQIAIRTSARPPFRLAPTGHPAVAIFWKNLTAAVRVLSLRVMLVVILPAFVGSVTALASGAPWNRELASVVFAVLAASITFFGVQVYRIDFRFDLPNLDLLKSFPLRGADLARAEVLAPFVVLALAEQLFLTGAAILCPPSVPLPIPRAPLALSLMLLLPSITLPGLLVQNMAALLFPAWADAGPTPTRGVEAIGQRLLTLMGTLVVVVVMLAPAAALGGATAAITWRTLGPWAAPLAALVAAMVVALEASVGFRLLGRAFDRFDPARA